jgi:hypothetical protein
MAYFNVLHSNSFGAPKDIVSIEGLFVKWSRFLPSTSPNNIKIRNKGG